MREKQMFLSCPNLQESNGAYKSLYRSRAGKHFYGTENEIWAGFGPMVILKKNWGRLWATFEGDFSGLQGSFFLIIVASLKSCIKLSWEKKKKKLFEIYLVINLNRLNILNQLCIALLKIPPCATSIYWLCFAHLVWLLLYFKTRSKYILRWMSRPYKLYNTYD